MNTSVPADIKSEIFQFRYRERFQLSTKELLEEPWEALYQANLIWSLDDKRAKLEAERHRRDIE